MMSLSANSLIIPHTLHLFYLLVLPLHHHHLYHHSVPCTHAFLPPHHHNHHQFFLFLLFSSPKHHLPPSPPLPPRYQHNLTPLLPPLPPRWRCCQCAPSNGRWRRHHTSHVNYKRPLESTLRPALLTFLYTRPSAERREVVVVVTAGLVLCSVVLCGAAGAGAAVVG